MVHTCTSDKTIKFTCTSWKSTTLLAVNSMKEYEPYLALWPGLSDLPSPANTRGVFCCWNCARRDSCFEFQTVWMEGCKYLCWCRKKVCLLMAEQFKNSKILNDLDGRAPVHRMAADIIMLPAGMCPMNGWLSQVRFRLHTLHSWVIFNNGPITSFLIVVSTLLQNTQQEKSDRSEDSNTR